MKMCTIIYIIAFLSLINISFCMDLPVFIFDDGILRNSLKFPTNPFKKLSPTEFTSIVSQVQTYSETVIFFIEETFCVEDISTKDDRGTPYPFMRQSFLERKTAYLPKVVDPYGSFRHKFQSAAYNTLYLRSTTTRLRLDDTYKFLYIYFVDGPNETRVETLRRHDLMIKAVMHAVRQLSQGPVTAFYTGKKNPVFRGGDGKLDKTHPLSADRSNETLGPVWVTQHCGNATFEFLDPQLVNGLEAYLKPVDCRYIRGTGVEFSYEIIFDSFVNMNRGKRYRMRFHFSPLMKAARGWKLFQVDWNADEYGTLYMHSMTDQGLWDRPFFSTKSILIKPVDWYESKCIIDRYKITLHSKPGQATTMRAFTTPNEVVYWLDKTIKNFTMEEEPIRLGEGPIPPDSKPPDSTPPDSTTTDPSTTDPSTTDPSTTDITDPTIPAEEEGEDDEIPLEPAEIFTTTPISVGVLLSILFVVVLLWAVGMLLNCHGNNKMDTIDTKPIMTAEQTAAS